VKRVPHTWVLLAGLALCAAIATHLVPAGEYARVERDGRLLVDAESYRVVEPRPATAGDLALAFPRGLEATARIVFYILLIGGSFAVVQATGAIDTGVGLAVHACRRREALVVPLLMLVFALGGGTFGMAEETLPFLPALVLLARKLDYDDVTGGAIALVGAGAGFSGAFLNPFTVGVAQGIAGLPLFSGMAFRFAVWCVMTTLAIVYVSRYARRERAERRERSNVAVVRAGSAGSADIAESRSATESTDSIASAPSQGQARRVGVLVVLVAAIVFLVVGALRWDWGLLEMGGLFLGVAVAAGVIGGLGANRTAEVFVEGLSAMTGGALVVGLARATLVLLDHARVTDTILHALASGVSHLPGWATVSGIYAVQVALSYLVPSGSGQAALTMPILAPLGDLVGVTRQTSVLAYQFGDGFSNIFTPTSGYFMAGLALIKVPWTKWVRFLWPLQVMWLAAGLVLLLIAHAIHWGPF
jgi:uncharacterized ion transporter superfamily protein YfcC